MPTDATEAPFSRIDVFEDIAGAVEPWSVLQNSVPCTPYQTDSWARAWCDTVGRARGQSPLIVVASSAAGRPVALLPLTRSRFATVVTAGFIGGKDSNANLGLFTDPTRWHAGSIRALLRHTARAAGVDLFVFRHQPETWRSQQNLLLTQPHQRSPSRWWSGALMSDPDQTLAARLSKHARKLLRQKEARLAQTGPVEHRRAITAKDLDAVVDAYVLQKRARAVATGIPGPSTAENEFLRRAAMPAHSAPGVEWHALWRGPDVVATFGGAGHQGHFSGMVLAFDQAPDVARCSPGEILIKHVMADLSRRGFSGFDLGVGDARYKETFCDTADVLHDSFIGVSVRGQAAAMMLAGLGHAKRKAKNSELVSRAVRNFRIWRQTGSRSVSSQ